jgi:hypothetical protein
MSVTFPVREAVKDLLAAGLVGANLPSQPAGTLTIYNSPEDDDPTGIGPITLASFPTIIVQKGLYAETDTWRRYTQAEVYYQWWVEIIVYLAEEKLPSWEAQKLVEDWQTAVADVILAQPTLNGTVEHIIQGEGGQFMFSRDGFYDWYTQSTRNPDSYWGIGFRFQVEQAYSFAETVGVNN